MKKNCRVLLLSLLTIFMLLSCACAEEKLIDLTMDSGLCGFQTFKEGGVCELENDNGELAILIENCGQVNYANQIYWDGFSLTEGCVYVFEFDARCEIERTMEYRLQLNGGDYHGYLDVFDVIGPEAKHIVSEFTAMESDPAPRLAFNLGIQEDMAADPGKHTVWLDNIRLRMIDDSNAVIQEAEPEDTARLRVNQVGYRPGDAKIVVAASALVGCEYDVVHAETGEIAYSGVFGSSRFDAATRTAICKSDFSALTDEGDYFIRVKTADGEKESYAFRIADDVYDELYLATLRMLFTQRCGTELTPAQVGDFAHPVCHDAPAVIWGTEQTLDVSGGWHDAGDYGRYIVPGVKAALDLMLAYEMNAWDALVSSDDLGLPESGNGVPDILDEVRWELDWMFKMQDELSGGVYHKVSGYNFPGTVMPEDETAQLVICPISATATGDFAAAMAKAAVVYAPFDAEFADRCLAAAKRAWTYLTTANGLVGFTNPSDVSTGEYPDPIYSDECFIAAAELAVCAAFRDEAADESVQAVIEATLTEGIPAGLGWIEMGAYGLYDIAVHIGDVRAAKLLCAAADELVTTAARDGYGCSLGANYPWGSNMGVASNGMLLLLANKVVKNEDYVNAAKAQLDVLLGCNGMDYCYVTGFGTKATSDPHHRPSQAKGHAVPGMLAGGPNMNLEDPYAKQVLAGSAPALCYTDSQQSYSTNEVAIYWNSPLVFLISGI